MVVGCDWSATGCRYSVTVALTNRGCIINIIKYQSIAQSIQYFNYGYFSSLTKFHVPLKFTGIVFIDTWAVSGPSLFTPTYLYKKKKNNYASVL